MSEKKRLDCLLFDMGLAESREKAKTLIMMGQVYVDNQKSDKPGTPVSEDAKIEVRGGGLPYVSRGGLKLEKAMHTFDISLKDKICMDIGASTGGFTDCMLQNGAKKVYSIDVGYGQLAWKLRTNPNVVNLERTNVRYITREQVPDDKKGVVRDSAVHKEVIEKIRNFVLEQGFSVIDITYSPVKGPEGNIEYLIYIRKSEHPEDMSHTDISSLVAQSHQQLNGGESE